jgi:DNA-binding CsgD family transcriptional regulator
MRRKSPVREMARDETSLSGPVQLGAGVLSDTAWSEIKCSLGLSGRELEITRGIFDNLTEGAIAADLCISEHTVHMHLNRLYRKIQVSTRTQIVLRVLHEFLLLTALESSCLPPICRNRAKGRCPIQDRPAPPSSGVGYSAVA